MSKVQTSNEESSKAGLTHQKGANAEKQDNAVLVKPRIIKPYQIILVWLCRILVGGVFIISGIAKCIDPWGFIYKIQDYLNVWDWNVAYSYVVVGAFAMAIVEFTIGVMTLFGNFRRLSVWVASAMMLFLLPLTIYIYIANPVSDCGCFGDMIILSNGATLAKNVVITVALVYLWCFNRKVDSVYAPYMQWVTVVATVVYSFIICLYGYSVQPMLDFRPFHVGLEVSKIATDANEQRFQFLYSYNGGPAEAFDEDNIPDEDGWEFVDRVPVKDSDSRGESADFAVFDNGGNDVTIDIFEDPELTSNLMVALIPDVSKADLSCSWLIRSLSDYLHTQGGQLITIGNENSVYAPTAQYYTADATAIKQMARGHVALVYIKDGVIQWKRTASSLTTDLLDQLQPQQTHEDVLMEIEPQCESLFWGLTVLYIIFLSVYFLVTTAAMQGWRMRQRKRLRKRLQKIKHPLESLTDKGKNQESDDADESSDSHVGQE